MLTLYHYAYSKFIGSFNKLMGYHQQFTDVVRIESTNTITLSLKIICYFSSTETKQ